MSGPRVPPASAESASSLGRHLGDLARGDVRLSVHLETRPDPRSATLRRPGVQGRLHFLDGARQRTSGWIFLEDSEPDVLARFNEFSPAELWRLAESLA